MLQKHRDRKTNQSALIEQLNQSKLQMIPEKGEQRASFEKCRGQQRGKDEVAGKSQNKEHNNELQKYLTQGSTENQERTHSPSCS